MKGLGANISKWRRRRLLTQSELAKKLGVQTSTLGSYEIDRREPPLDKLCAIADVLNVSIDTLLNREKVPAVDLVGSLLHAPEYKLDVGDQHQLQFLHRLLEEAGYKITPLDNGDIEIETPMIQFTNYPNRDIFIEQPRVFLTIQTGIPVCIVMGLKLGAARLAEWIDVIRANKAAGLYDKPKSEPISTDDDVSTVEPSTDPCSQS